MSWHCPLMSLFQDCLMVAWRRDLPSSSWTILCGMSGMTYSLSSDAFTALLLKDFADPRVHVCVVRSHLRWNGGGLAWVGCSQAGGVGGSFWWHSNKNSVIKLLQQLTVSTRTGASVAQPWHAVSWGSLLLRELVFVGCDLTHHPWTGRFCSATAGWTPPVICGICSI